MKPEELWKKFWFPGLLQHQDLGQLQKIISTLKVLSWTSPNLTLFSAKDCRILYWCSQRKTKVDFRINWEIHGGELRFQYHGTAVEKLAQLWLSLFLVCLTQWIPYCVEGTWSTIVMIPACVNLRIVAQWIVLLPNQNPKELLSIKLCIWLLWRFIYPQFKPRYFIQISQFSSKLHLLTPSKPREC